MAAITRSPSAIAGCLAPMLATSGELPPAATADDYAYEVKWDGYRAIAMRSGRTFRLCSRSGLDLLPRFPELRALGEVLPEECAVDGELVAIDEAGHAGFSALQTRMPGIGGQARHRPWDARRWRISFMAFDLLVKGRRDLTARPWQERRLALEGLNLAGPAWACPPYHGDGGTLLAAIAEAGGEGIIAKRRDAPYLPGRRSPAWIKVKVARRAEFVVGGYWRGGRHAVLGSLLLGVFDSPAAARAGTLRYVGKVGTGFDEAERAALRRVLDGLRSSEPPFTEAVPAAGVVWCTPRLVVEIGYAEWTHDGHLRHARYAGVRRDKPARAVLAERPPALGVAS